MGSSDIQVIRELYEDKLNAALADLQKRDPSKLSGAYIFVNGNLNNLPKINVRDVPVLLTGSSTEPTLKDEGRLEGDESSQEFEQRIEERAETAFNVLVNYFDFDPKTIVERASIKGSSNIDIYAFRFTAQGEKLLMLVSNCYGHATYLIPEDRFTVGDSKRDLIAKGAVRFYWQREFFELDRNHDLKDKIADSIQRLLRKNDCLNNIF